MNGKLSPLFPPPAGNAVNTTSRRRRGHVIGLTALFTNGPRLKPGYFDALKDDTHGLMPGAISLELYKLALAGKCDVIDVGVGRGATSIASRSEYRNRVEPRLCTPSINSVSIRGGRIAIAERPIRTTAMR